MTYFTSLRVFRLSCFLLTSCTCILWLVAGVVDAVPKCIVTSDSSPCTTVTEWKDNLLCRIQGPADENGIRSGGYVADSIPKMDDSMDTVKRKLASQKVYATLSVVLNSDWIFQNPYVPIRTLVQYERILNKVGLVMYGVNWIVSPKMCGFNGKAMVACGDKGGSLIPTECG